MRGAIFDLDGTLADTAEDLLGAANAMLAPRRLPLLELARDKLFAGRGGRSMIRRSLSLMDTPPSGGRSMIRRSLSLMDTPPGEAAAEAIADDL